MLLRLLCALARPRRVYEALEDAGGVVFSWLEPHADLRETLRAGGHDLVLLDERALTRKKAPAIAQVRDTGDRPEVVVFVEREDAVARARLLADGAMAVIYRDLEADALGAALRALLERRREDVLARLPTGPPHGPRLEDLTTRSPAMRACLQVARRVVDADSSLLVLGETGAGKEHLARALHASGPRARGPFVAVNCAALPEALLESELFGHVAGAFTGAQRTRRGHFELAHGGTLFLDEVGELPLHLQAKLLRALQERRVQPLGAERELEVDVRVVAATNRDLEGEARARRFRADLYYRLAVVSLTVPPLRERLEDLPLLVERCVEEARARLKRPPAQLTPEAMAQLASYGWPGNVRELANVLERALLLCSDGRITPVDLPARLRPASSPEAPAPPPPAAEAPPDLLQLPWREARERVVHELEQRYFRALLERTHGRVGDAARLSDMDPRSLYEKLRQLGLRKEDFRPTLPSPR